MGSIEEGFCRDDSDCSEKQYCYHVSHQCVNYTLCSRYNRAENNKPARSASQCGLCLPNYTAEELGTGEFATICKRINSEISTDAGSGITTWIIAGSITGSLVFLAGIIALIIFIRRCRKPTQSKSEFCGDLHTMEPSAPVETSPFLELKKKSFNNNQILKDKNRLVHASAFNHPSWVTCDPNYENNLNNNHDGMNALEQFNSTSTSDSPNALVPTSVFRQTMQGDNNRAHIENSVNAALVQRNNTSSSNATGDDTPQDNHNSNGSTSGANNTQDGRERAQSSNILIAQINVNVLNHDC